jgi:polygalacturonase
VRVAAGVRRASSKLTRGVAKPKFFAAHSLTSSTIAGITLRNMPVQGFSIDGASYLTLSNIVVDNSAGTAEGHNTDAFDIGDSDHVEIHGATVSNQDVSGHSRVRRCCKYLCGVSQDCVAVNSGTNYYFTGLSCTGGHGLSIGSVGGRSDNTVQNVTFASSSVSNSQNGVRIKTVYGATGTVSGVTYSGITLSGITNYGVVIEQDYENGSPTGTASLCSLCGRGRC